MTMRENNRCFAFEVVERWLAKQSGATPLGRPLPAFDNMLNDIDPAILAQFGQTKPEDTPFYFTKLLLDEGFEVALRDKCKRSAVPVPALGIGSQEITVFTHDDDNAVIAMECADGKVERLDLVALCRVHGRPVTPWLERSVQYYAREHDAYVLKLCLIKAAAFKIECMRTHFQTCSPSFRDWWGVDKNGAMITPVLPHSVLLSLTENFLARSPKSHYREVIHQHLARRVSKLSPEWRSRLDTSFSRRPPPRARPIATGYSAARRHLTTLLNPDAT